MKPVKRVTVYLSEEMYESMRTYGFHSRLSFMDIIREALDGYLKERTEVKNHEA